jgi:hypothetical protein
MMAWLKRALRLDKYGAHASQEPATVQITPDHEKRMAEEQRLQAQAQLAMLQRDLEASMGRRQPDGPDRRHH